MLCARALLSVSEFSLAMTAFSALCIAPKLLDITLLDGVTMSTGALLLTIDGSLGLTQMANWYEEKRLCWRGSFWHWRTRRQPVLNHTEFPPILCQAYQQI